MVIYLYGKDLYRRNQKVRDIVSSHKRRASDGAVRTFDFSEGSTVDEFFSFTASFSLFPSSTLCILKNVLMRGNADVACVLLKRIRARVNDRNNVFVFSEESLPPHSYAFLTKPPSRTQEFPFLSPAEAVRFLKKEISGIGDAVPEDIVQTIASTYAHDLYAAMSILVPLAYAPASYDRTALLAHAGIRQSIAFFPLFNLLKNPSLSRRLTALEQMLAHHEEPAKLFAMLSYQKGYTTACAAYDAGLKQGGIEYEEALIDLVLQAGVPRAQ